MKIIKDDKVVVNIPGWVLLAGVLLVDNLATNVMRLIAIKSESKK